MVFLFYFVASCNPGTFYNVSYHGSKPKCHAYPIIDSEQEERKAFSDTITLLHVSQSFQLLFVGVLSFLVVSITSYIINIANCADAIRFTITSYFSVFEKNKLKLLFQTIKTIQAF